MERMSLHINPMTEENQREAEQFLLQFEDTSIFLLGNLRKHGPNLGSHVNSGNFKIIRLQEKIVCVFCLVRRGNILVQSEVVDPQLFEIIISSCKEEVVPVYGLIAEWIFAEPFWQFLKDHRVIRKELYHSKEISYSLNLETVQAATQDDARALSIADYSQWKTLRNDYLAEQQLPQNTSPEEMFCEFSGKVGEGIIWGMFLNSQIVSIGELNARTENLATVGGVYTTPRLRRQGLGQSLMKRLIYDCKNKLHLNKLIIFTGEEENKPAQKLYESLGCLHIGYIGLFFGEG